MPIHRKIRRRLDGRYVAAGGGNTVTPDADLASVAEGARGHEAKAECWMGLILVSQLLPNRLDLQMRLQRGDRLIQGLQRPFLSLVVPLQVLLGRTVA